jgi:hypothetical protein
MTVLNSWLDLWNSEEPLDFDEFLQSPLLAARRNQLKFRVISSHVCGSISFIASLSLALHILRTHDGLSTTYHRLVMGLSIADMMSSFAVALSSIMVPKEMNYLVPNAGGNAASCGAQGFLIMVGYCSGMMYNSCICCYYLSIVKYNKTDEYIRNKLEPWFHGVAVIYPLVSGFIILGYKGMLTISTGSPVCYHELRNNPPHCIGREDGFLPESFTIPCGRGGGFGRTAYTMNKFAPIVIVLVTIVSTMIIMYRAVLKTEKNIQRFGSRALRVSRRPRNSQRTSVRPHKSSLQSSILKRLWRSSTTLMRRSSLFGFKSTSSVCNPTNHLDTSVVGNVNDATTEEVGAEGVMDKIKSACNFQFLPRCRRREDNVRSTRSNTMAQQKRSILRMAFLYSMAWVFAWIPFTAYTLFHSFPAEMFVAIFTPLQGLYNLFVFLYPRARDINNRSNNAESIGWLQAFAKAYKSKGGTKRNISLSSTNSRSFFSRSRSKRLKLSGKPSSAQKSAARKNATISNSTTDQPQQQVVELNHRDIRVDIGEKIQSQPNANELLPSFKEKTEEISNNTIDHLQEGVTKTSPLDRTVDEENANGNSGASDLRRVTFKIPSGIVDDEHC